MQTESAPRAGDGGGAGEVGGVAERREDDGGGVRPQPLHEIHAHGGGVSLLVHHHIHGAAEPNRTARDGSEQVGRHGYVISLLDWIRGRGRRTLSPICLFSRTKRCSKKQTLADSARWLLYCKTPKNILFIPPRYHSLG